MELELWAELSQAICAVRRRVKPRPRDRHPTALIIRVHLRSALHARRLASGRPIGSGLIEGGCKNAIGARLKLNAARWRVRRAEHMGHLRCLEYSQLWTTYWENRAA